MKKILTICIATYNRSFFLNELLKNIIDEISDVKTVSILVVDGCSTDDTIEVCKKYSKMTDFFKSIHLSEKGGIDKDFDIAVRKATTEFCWLFCDDDKIKKGAIKLILDKIYLENPDLMIINSSVCNYNLEKVLLEKHVNLEKDIVIEKQHNMQDQLFQICKTYLSFTGALLFKRDLWCNVDTEVFYGNRFGDMCTIANFPQSSKVLIMQEPCVLIRLGNAEWSNINFKVWYKYYREAIIKHSQLSDKVKKILVPDTLFWHLKFLLYNRAMDTYKLSHYKEYLKQRSFKIRFIGIMIFLVPSFLIRWFFIIIAICQKNSLALYNFTEGRKSKNSWLSSE